MSKKLTPWFPPEVKPVRRGVYETRFGLHAGYSYWSGSRWGNQRLLRLVSAHEMAGAVQNKSWRGLAEKPR